MSSVEKEKNERGGFPLLLLDDESAQRTVTSQSAISANLLL